MPEYTVVMVGKTGHGKSRVGNSILGKNNAFPSSPMGSSTTMRFKTCMKESGTANGVDFHVIDTPGVMDTDVDAKTTLSEIRNCRQLCPDGVTALLLVMRFGERFTKEEEATIDQLKSLFGENLFEYGIVIFTHGDLFEQARDNGEVNSFSQYIEGQPEHFKNILQKVNRRYVRFNNLLKGQEAMPQRRDLVEHLKDIIASTGGKPYMIPEIRKGLYGLLVDCFPATSSVLIDGKDQVKMASLQLGTKVLSISQKGAAPAKLDTVYFFTHSLEDVLALYVCITTAGGKTLYLSEGHYIYVGEDALQTGALVTAREVQPGDVVHVVDAPDQAPRPEHVTAVKTEIKRGLYCPHTLGGSLVVDGVCVSTYTEMFPPSVAHALLWPVRVLYRVAPNVAAKVAQPEEKKGMPAWLGWLSDRYVAWAYPG